VFTGVTGSEMVAFGAGFDLSVGTLLADDDEAMATLLEGGFEIDSRDVTEAMSNGSLTVFCGRLSEESGLAKSLRMVLGGTGVATLERDEGGEPAWEVADAVGGGTAPAGDG
jgi:hypothetical protein